MPQALFWISSIVAVISALGVVFSPQAAQSVYWMFAVLISLSGVMASIGAYLLSLITLLVYAGAILVLFVFVIMFMGQPVPLKQIGWPRLMGAFLAAALMILLLFPLGFSLLSAHSGVAVDCLSRTEWYGTEQFGRYQLLTQLGAWIILWVGVGAFKINNGRLMK